MDIFVPGKGCKRRKLAAKWSIWRLRMSKRMMLQQGLLSLELLEAWDQLAIFEPGKGSKGRKLAAKCSLLRLRMSKRMMLGLSQAQVA